MSEMYGVWEKVQYYGMLFVRRFFLGWLSVHQLLSEVSVQVTSLQQDVSRISDRLSEVERLGRSRCVDCPVADAETDSEEALAYSLLQRLNPEIESTESGD